jgi:hypothetical protein
VIATVVPVVPVLMRFTEAPQAFVWSLLLFLCWLSFWNLFLAFRLRRVVANTKQLCIKTMSGEKIINYGDINYVSETVIVSPKLIFLKYRDTSAGESKLILVVPDTMFFSFFSEYPMTTFLRAQVMRANPNYRRDAEPSRWRPPFLFYC